MADKIIVVTGATGKQGGATLRHLAKAGGFELRGMTRNPDSDAAKELTSLGIQVVKGDLDDKTSIANAVSGAWGVFGLQNTWEAGVQKEEEQGKRLVATAREQGVQHFVYTSVGSAERKTGIPHFDNKARVEDVLRAAGFPSYAILRPVFFMENLLAPWLLQGDKLCTALAPTTKLQMIAADDIGRFAAKAFLESTKWNKAEVELAGDFVTMVDGAKAVGEIVGKDVTFEPIPLEAVRANSEDLALMLAWFEKVGYGAKIDELEPTWGVRPLDLGAWVATQKK